jgi:hypothetical protein
MPIEIQWNDEDPQSGTRRYLRAEKFAGQWHFKWKLTRRGEWHKGLQPTREMWEHVLDSLKRRYVRREGVSDEDVAQVEKILKALPVPRELDDDAAGDEG